MAKKSLKYSAELIAKWFLAHNRQVMAEEDAEYISNLKLQKLLYYAQGVYYAMKNKVLFDDEIMAWKHGPVVEDVYHDYKSNGANGIKFEDEFDFSKIDGETTEVLEEVYDYFGQYSAWKLRNMTHNEEPWKKTEMNDEINVDLIKEYFLREYIE
ncbi:SocA family protein [Sedimentibacter hydroxybenzoicus DSM 7310]|uniref:SocA family protein n=1 Tax=Sedimentibacter hydroxybenzoicus DSM 7310 TaxID=1123245 RepID=A0A974BG89_SEDHY|nr:type II toxin-antitoxin system antitoxin SocA domain-containing protein [Sedimentibacter hydroxybenzoicus]NYB72524.1 SocA family protein [Sedimentibacter hydroxybenzoicus DSM 7310]